MKSTAKQDQIELQKEQLGTVIFHSNIQAVPQLSATST